VHVTSAGGRFRFEDDQETPDTHVVTFTFPGGKAIAWEGLSCSRMPAGDRAGEVVFHGEKGTMALRGGGYAIFDPAGKEVERVTGPGGDALHVANFLRAIREGAALTSEIEEGHKSTLLCHLGNIAHRTGRALRCDAANGHILGDREAMALWRRKYADGWEPKV
jgi:predicted dehydrogenase